MQRPKWKFTYIEHIRAVWINFWFKYNSNSMGLCNIEMLKSVFLVLYSPEFYTTCLWLYFTHIFLGERGRAIRPLWVISMWDMYRICSATLNFPLQLLSKHFAFQQSLVVFTAVTVQKRRRGKKNKCYWYVTGKYSCEATTLNTT